jgi:hypothetical protein
MQCLFLDVSFIGLYSKWTGGFVAHRLCIASNILPPRALPLVYFEYQLLGRGLLAVSLRCSLDSYAFRHGLLHPHLEKHPQTCSRIPATYKAMH